MREEINQSISRLIDGDLGYDESLGMLKKIQSDEELKAKMLRYQAISQAIKAESFIQVRSDFLANISQQIQQEPNYLLPRHKSKITESFNKKLFAVAASALLGVAIVGHNLSTNPTLPQNFQAANNPSIPSQNLPSILAKNGNVKPNQRHPLTAQFNEYLQAHNSSIYTTGAANFHPHAKMAVYDR